MSVVKRVVAALAFVAVLVGGRGARAQIPVIDSSNLVQNAITAAKTAQTVINTYHQIQQLATQIQNQLQMLRSINPTTFSGLLALLRQGQFTYAMLQGDLSSIGYNINQINRDFDRMFPRSQSQWTGYSYSDFNNYYDRWNGEIETSSKAAARAQAGISNLDANNNQIASILAQANSASTGQVRQLQLVNQQLALIHGELGALVQNLATTGRVLTDWAAAGVGEQMMGRERGRRRLDGYTSRGNPSRVLNALP